MTHATSSSALLDGRAFAHVLSARGQKAAVQSFLWILASLCTAVAILGIVFAVSAQKQREAGRIIVEGQKGGASYLSIVTRAMTESQGRPTGL